jgi:hypothetical protein
MKKLLFILLMILSGISCYSQIIFEKGYFINNADQKINCLIKNLDWENNPIQFEYQLSENDEPVTATIASVKAFGIDGASKYIRQTVNIDRSSEEVSKLSYGKNPQFQEELFFLRVLVEGKASLYQYKDGNLTRYFYSSNNSPVEQLIHKSYITSGGKIGKNNQFRQQLLNGLSCATISNNKFENLEYKKNSLISFFRAYNQCSDVAYLVFEEDQKVDFNLTIRPRINNSSLTIQNYATSRGNTDFGNKVGFGMGIESEFTLPFNKSKWAVIIEPSYQNFKSTVTTEVNNHLYGNMLVSNADYQSLELPVGLRHYFFLNPEFRLFLNTLYMFDILSGSSISFSRADGSPMQTIEIKTGTSLAVGMGYKYKAYGLELRYNTGRDILKSYANWGADYNTLSIIFGFSLF